MLVAQGSGRQLQQPWNRMGECYGTARHNSRSDYSNDEDTDVLWIAIDQTTNRRHL
jgi:hypothetical protein